MDPMRSSRVDPMYPQSYSGERPSKYGGYTTYPYNYPQGAYPQQLGVAYSNYPQRAYLPRMQQQQQQASVVIIGRQQQRAYVSGPSLSFTGPIVLSCFVFWLCGWLFGMIAFILAMVGHSYTDGDVTTARHLYRASYGVSIAGIVVGLILIVTIIAVVATGISGSYPSYSSCSSSSSCYYYYYDSYGCKQCCYTLSSSCFYNSG